MTFAKPVKLKQTTNRDPLTRSERSQRMRLVQAKGNKTTETRFCAAMSSLGINGWRRHPMIHGSPDIGFNRERVAVFLDGCFWHRCPTCARRYPRSGRSYWKPKLDRNGVRDRAVGRKLRREGWLVVRIWEHSILESPRKCVLSLDRVLKRRRGTLGERSQAKSTVRQ